MKRGSLFAALCAAALALPAAAQTVQSPDSERPAASGSSRSGDQPSESKRCSTLTGAEKDQCIQDENTKTDSKAAPDTAGAGSSAPRSSDSSADTARKNSELAPD